MIGHRGEGTSTAIIVSGAPSGWPLSQAARSVSHKRVQASQTNAKASAPSVESLVGYLSFSHATDGMAFDGGGVLPQHGGDLPESRQVGAPDVALVAQSEKCPMALDGSAATISRTVAGSSAQ